MAYIGKTPTIGNFQKCDAISVVNGQAAYTLQVGGSNVSAESPNHILVSLNGVLQAPTDSYTVSGATLTFASNLATGDVIDFVILLGNVLDLGTPSDATVTTAKLADNNITTAKLAYNPNPNRNIIINGDMSIAQRGTSFATMGNGDTQYTLDRFQWNEEGSFGDAELTITQDTTVPTGQGFAKSLKAVCTTVDTSIDSNTISYITQKFEGQNLQYLKRGTSSAESLTLSFWARSNLTGTFTVAFKDIDNSRLYSASYSPSSADTWEKFIITIPGDTSGALDNDNAHSFSVDWNLQAGTNKSNGSLTTAWEAQAEGDRAVGQTNFFSSTSNNFYLTGVQLEAGTTASDFEFLPVDVNLQRCLRYFQDLAPKKDDCRIAIGENVSGSRCDPVFQYVEKRANPSVTFTAANTFSLYNANTSRDCTSMSADNFSEICGNLNANVSSGLTPTGGASQFITNGTGSQIFVDAEL